MEDASLGPVTPEQKINENHALAYGLGAIVLWSTVATGFKLGLQVLAIEQLLLLGTAISWLVFFAYAAITRNFALSPADRKLVVLLGLINPFAYYLVLFSAYDRLPAHIAQPLNYTWAITLALLAVPILKQALSRRMLAGIFISYAGVCLLLLTANPHAEDGWSISGIVLALLSTLLWALYWLLNTRSNSPPAALMFWSFSVALIPVSVVCVLGAGLPAVNTTTLAYGAWVGCIEMGITFILWQQALRKTRQTARIGQLIFLSPFLSLIMIHFVLGEDISLGAIAGLIIIVLGLHVARRAQPAP